MISNRRFDVIVVDDLRALVSSSYTEDQGIEYKQELPDLDGKKPDDARKKLLADVAAFANASGGDILYGVEEGRTNGSPNGIPVALPGLEGPNADVLHRRWVGIIESGLDPKMAPKVRIRAIPTGEGTRAVVLLRVPRSYAAPHMVKESGRFHVRYGPENRTLDTAEIRAAFSLSETWAIHVRRFRDERVGRIIADDTPVKLVDTTRLVLHIVPLAAASRGFAIDLRKLKAGNLRPVYCDSWASSFNLDGLLVVGDPNGDTSHTYTQFFRDGSVEVVLTTIADEKHVYPSTRIEPHMVKTTKGYLPILVDVGAAYPFALTATLLGMKGLGPPPGNWGERTGTLLPRDVVFLPDVVLETDDADFASVLRPTFDALWQSLGHEGSPNYSAKGEWTGKTK